MSRSNDFAIARRVVLLVFAATNLWGWTSCHTRALSPFEKFNAEAARNNPEGLRVELRTRDEKGAYHLYETIPIDLIFASSTPATYSIELSEGMNAAGRTNHFFVEPTDIAFENNIFPYGMICCGSDRPYLRHAPTVLHRDLTNFLRFEKAGRYQVFYSTRRVFRGKANPNSKDIYQEQSELTATSNLLNLTILPDDPEWDAKHLSEVLRQMKDPKVRAAHDQAMAAVNRGSVLAVDLASLNEFPETEFERARTALQALDSEEAIEQRIMLIPKLGRHTYTNPEPITSTTRPDRMFLAMQKRAEQTDFGIDDNYVALWAAVLSKRDHPELLRPTRNEEIQKQGTILYAQARGVATKQILQLLETSVSRKNRMARAVTQQTIQDLRRDNSD
jgi:hypothetical protein